MIRHRAAVAGAMIRNHDAAAAEYAVGRVIYCFFNFYYKRHHLQIMIRNHDAAAGE